MPTKTSHRNRVLSAVLGFALAAILCLGAASSARAAGVSWAVTMSGYPTNMAPGGTGAYEVIVKNIGREASAGQVTVTATLPAGVTVSGSGAGDNYNWECPGSAGSFVVVCNNVEANFPVVAARQAMAPLMIPVDVAPSAEGSGQANATVSGGGGSEAATSSRTVFSSTPAPFEVTAFEGEVTDSSGRRSTQAGAHPDITTRIVLSSKLDQRGVAVPVDNLKQVHVELPPGLLGDPTATPRCTAADLRGTGTLGMALCPPETQVGTTDLDIALGLPTGFPLVGWPVYNVVPPKGVAAEFAFNVYGVIVPIDATVDANGYFVSADIRNINQGLAFMSSKLTLWGQPADPIHDIERFEPQTRSFGTGSSAPQLPLMTAPTSCPGHPLRTTMTAASWGNPGNVQSASFDADASGLPIVTEGCEKLPFKPRIGVTPDSPAQRAAPAGIGVDLEVPQNKNPTGLATSQLRKAVVTLPEGMAVNSASASELAACSPGEIGLGSSVKPSCPDASKLGSLQIETPVLEEPLTGAVYLAAQKDNPFGSTLALYFVAEGPGVTIKLPGRIDTGPDGRVTTTFDDNPQLPFEKLSVRFKTGPRAALTLPATCGPATTTAVLTPGSGTAPVTSRSSFAVTADKQGACDPGFSPGMRAGTENPVAGSFSPFGLQLTRGEGDLAFASIPALNLPSGLLASLKGVPYCPDSALAAISGQEGTGRGQLASPSCPAASQIGSVEVGAGAGPTPLYVNTGKVYLAGPYKGAPLSLAVVVPAVAGPFDLGSVVVRNALQVDPVTAAITAVSDPLPSALYGIPLNLRDVRIKIDRPDFTLNPTSCDPMEVKGTIAAVEGKSANVSSHFQVANCERLSFKPKLKLSLSGAPTRRGGYPKLRAELTMPKGANIQRAQVLLPKTELLENSHIRTICTRVQYAAGKGGGASCPSASIYGYAKAWTPLLDKPLEGPVYLRSSSHQLPDLVASLDGQIHIDLVGRIDAKNARIRNTFESVPDAPVSKFVLTMQGGKKGLLANNTDLCRTTPRANATFLAQNGKEATLSPVAKVGCKGKARQKKR